jgi:hypothetical protein
MCGKSRLPASPGIVIPRACDTPVGLHAILVILISSSRIAVIINKNDYIIMTIMTTTKTDFYFFLRCSYGQPALSYGLIPK